MEHHCGKLLSVPPSTENFDRGELVHRVVWSKFVLLREQVHQPSATKRGGTKSRHHRHEMVLAVPAVPSPDAANPDHLRSWQHFESSDLLSIFRDGEIEIQPSSGPS